MKSRLALCNFLALFFPLAPFTVLGQANPGARIQALHGQPASSLLKRVDRGQLPSGAILNPEDQQIFLLHSQAEPDLGIVAVDFLHDTTHIDQGPPEQCGVFFISSDGRSRYVPTIGADFHDGPNLCGGVRALGIVPDPVCRPRLIAIFSQTNMHGAESPVPFLFLWNSRVSSYDLDVTTSEWLQKQERSNTIAQVRRLLRNRK